MLKRFLSVFLILALILWNIASFQVSANDENSQEQTVVNEYENFVENPKIITWDNLYFTWGVYYWNKQNDISSINTLSNYKIRSIWYSLWYYWSNYTKITDFLKNNSPVTYFDNESYWLRTYLDFFTSKNTSTYATDNFYYEIPINHEIYPNELYDSKWNRIFYWLAPYWDHYSIRIPLSILLSLDGEYITRPWKFKLIIWLEEVEFYFQAGSKSIKSPKNRFYNNWIFLNNNKIYINREDKSDLEIYAHEITRGYNTSFVSSTLVPLVDNWWEDIYFDFASIDFEKYSEFYLVNTRDFFAEKLWILNNFCNWNNKMEYRLSMWYNLRFSSENDTFNSLFNWTGTIFVKKIKNPHQSTIWEYFSEEDIWELNIIKQKDVVLTWDWLNQRYDISDLLDWSGLYQVKVDFWLDDFKNACISYAWEYNPDFGLTSSLWHSLLLDWDFSENIFLNDYWYLKRYRNIKNQFDNYIHNFELDNSTFGDYYLTLTTTDKDNELWNNSLDPYSLKEYLRKPKEDLILNFEYTDFLWYTWSISKIIKWDDTNLKNIYKFEKNYKFVEINSTDEWSGSVVNPDSYIFAIDPVSYIFKDGEYIQYKPIYEYIWESNEEMESISDEQKMNLSENNILVNLEYINEYWEVAFFLNDKDLVKYDITMEWSKVVLTEKSNPDLIIIPYIYEWFELENVIKKDWTKFKTSKEIIDWEFEWNWSLFSAYVDRLRNWLQSMEWFQDFIYLNEIFSSSGSFFEIKELELITDHETNIIINVENNTSSVPDKIDTEFKSYADEKIDTFKLNLSRISDSISSSITSASLEIKQNYSKISRKNIWDEKKVDFLRNFDFSLLLNWEKNNIEWKSIWFTLSNFIVNWEKIENTNNELYICNESNLTIEEIQKFKWNCSIIDKNNSEFITIESDFYIYWFWFDNKNDLNVSFDLNYQSIWALAE